MYLSIFFYGGLGVWLVKRRLVVMDDESVGNGDEPVALLMVVRS